LDAGVPALADGEFVSVVGPSGWRQVDAAQDLRGIEPPTAGTIIYPRASRSGGPNAAWVSCSRPRCSLPWLTVLENVMLPVRVLRLPRKAR